MNLTPQPEADAALRIRRVLPAPRKVEFRDIGDETEVILQHEHFPTYVIRDGNITGWEASFDLLASLL